ncbi:flagellar hook basal-body protein [Legionella geestiana]|uniref:flagellar hook-basal body protein n=1 Tax=Legionella geestiana TaxID=45065 RepID=UPI001092C1B1|nr:flagellar hook basal-body protein [Legionella geestiana]QDQ39629.1 flagellar hook basal-body protein [Legionella geestiana]
MLDGMSAIQAAMNTDLVHLEVVNNNIANLHTPGFRRQLVEALPPEGPLLADMPHVRAGLRAVSTTVAAPLQQTGNPFHLALSGEGYFVIHTENGTFYSRRGDVMRDGNGQLASLAGGFIEGESGAITLADDPFKVDGRGYIIGANGRENRLRLVRFKHPEALQAVGNGLLSSEEIPESASPEVIQGVLERANVQSVDEMLSLMRLSRHFEASQRVLRTLTSLQSNAINQLGSNNV